MARAENAVLRAQARRPDDLAVERGPAGPGPGSRQRWRTIVAVLLIVVGCVLAPLGGVAVWARNQVTNTDRSVRTVAPLAADPAIQQAIADQITTQIFTYIDVQALTNQALDALTERGLRPRLPTQLRARRPFPTIGPPTRPWTRMQLPRRLSVS